MNKRWWDGKGNYFLIIETKIIDGKEWVFYNNEQSGKQYSCLREAFIKYFTSQP